MRHPRLLWGLLAVFVSSPAWADVLTPDEAPCFLKAVGDQCSAMDAGLLCAPGADCVCQNASCSKLIYWCDDGGTNVGDGGDAAAAVDGAPVNLCHHEAGLAPCIKCYPVPVGTEDAGVDATVTPDEDAGDATVAPVEDGAATDATVATADAGADFDATAGDAAGSPEGGPAGAPSGGGCSCSVGPLSAMGGLVPWLVAGLVPMVLRRRRPRG